MEAPHQGRYGRLIPQSSPQRENPLEGPWRGIFSRGHCPPGISLAGSLGTTDFLVYPQRSYIVAAHFDGQMNAKMFGSSEARCCEYGSFFSLSSYTNDHLCFWQISLCAEILYCIVVLQDFHCQYIVNTMNHIPYQSMVLVTEALADSVFGQVHLYDPNTMPHKNTAGWMLWYISLRFEVECLHHDSCH